MYINLMIDLIYILYFVDAKHEDCQPSGIVENISALPRMKIKPHTFSRGSSMMVAAKLLLFLTSVIHHGSSQLTCPSECDCDFTYHVTVNCSSRGLSALPPDTPVNVSTLILRGNHLSGLDGLTRFHQLQVLDASHNVITNMNNDFSSMPNLLKLNLQGNKLTVSPNLQNSVIGWLDISGNDIQNLNVSQFTSNLTYLNISNNPLENGMEQINEYLTDLQVLDLSNISSMWTGNLSMENLSNLKEIYLRKNFLEECSDNVLSLNSSHLEIIDLSENNIIYLENCTFRQMPNLKELYLDGNNISDLSEKSFQSLPMLQVLSLNRNKIKQITSPVFQSMSSLQKLSLNNMPHLYYLSKTAFAGLRHLRELELSNNPHLSYISEELVSDMESLESLNLSHNNISILAKPMFSPLTNLHIDISGNFLVCDCHIHWINDLLRSNDTAITFNNPHNLTCMLNGSTASHLLMLEDNLKCPETSLQHDNSEVAVPVGSSARLHCPYQGDHPPIITWVTPRNVRLVFFNTHTLAQWNYPSISDVQQNGSFHGDHYWHDTEDYYPELSDYPDRMVILQDGSLFIDYVLRIDSGPFQCIVESPLNKSTFQILLRLDYQVLMEVKIFSLFVGLGCAASFFMLNLIYAFIAAAARKCISQRRREAIMQFLENFDQYKTNKLSSLRDNYNGQVARIRETYHNRMTKLRENYSTQMTRFREGASHIKEGTTHRVDIIKDKYQIKQRKLREYSSQQLHQLRDTYNTQLLKVREYGSLQLGKVHKKYKLKQKHMIKLLDTLNIDNCRTIIESECVRTDSMLFEPDDILCTPESQSISSDEYLTADSNNASNSASHENLQEADPDHLPDRHYRIGNGHVVIHNFVDEEDSQIGLSFVSSACSFEDVDQCHITIQPLSETDDKEEEDSQHLAQSSV